MVWESSLWIWHHFMGSFITLNLLWIIFPVSEISSMHERTVWLFDWMRLVHTCHWRELPQVSFLLWQKFCCEKITFVMTKYFCHILSWQNLSRQTFAVTNIIVLRQNFRHDKYTFVATNIVFVITKHVFCHEIKYACCDKTCCDKRVCRDKSFVTTNNFLMTKVYHDKPTFVMTKDVFFHDKHVCFDKTFVTKHLSQQKWYLWHLPPMMLAL